MGFFDFLKDVGFEAPKEEPRRGTLIQTDNVGTEDRPINRIATMPTDRGSRIISRDEFGRLNTDQGRGRDDVAFYERGQSRIGVDPRQMDTQAFSTPGIASGMQGRKFFIGQSNVDQDAPNLGRSYSDMPMTPIKNPRGVMGYPTDFMRLGEDAEIVSPLMPPPSNPRRGIRSFGDPNISLPPEGGMMRIAERMKSGYEDAFYPKTGEDSLITDEEPIMYKPVDPRRFRRRPNQRVPEGTVEARYNPETGTYTFFDSTQQEAMSDVAGPEKKQFYYDPESETYLSGSFLYPQTGNFGARLKQNNRHENELAGTFSPDNRGITTLAGRGRNLQKGFEEAYGVDVANDPNKAMQARLNDPQYQAFLETQDSPMAKYANMFGQKVLGYDDPFEMYKDTQATVARERGMEGQRQREEDRASRSRTQSTPFDPCPDGFTYDAEKRQCVPSEEETASTLGQKFVRNPQAFAGDPNMYGRVGGEYQFFTETPGMINAADGIPRGPNGEIRGMGGPKDDLIGPFMLSDQEYVMPKEMIMAAGGGSYNAGIKQLESIRKDSLNRYGKAV